jgi:L,D-peptidoglycan transpeptidase YkuD (ErfK/YbiS/YcfS/YnhG family)
MIGRHRNWQRRTWVTRLRRIGLLVAAPLALLVGAAVVAPLAFAQSAPPFSGYKVPGSQVVYVVAAKGSSSATYQLWQRSGKTWKRTLSVAAKVGRNGISPKANESSRYTPAGMFGLTEGFGQLKNPGTRLAYRYINYSDSWWWVSDTKSSLYNKPAWCPPASCSFDISKGENLGQVGKVYDHAIVMNYNRSPVVRGKGSAFFIHITNNQPTAGCVATSRAVVIQTLRWLDPKQHPVIITRTP